MTATYRLTPAALRDLDNIADYTLAHWGVDQMDRYVRRLMERCAWLAGYPNAGRRRPDIHPEYMCFPEGTHLVFYLSEADQVTVIGIVHQSMDVVAHFDG